MYIDLNIIAYTRRKAAERGENEGDLSLSLFQIQRISATLAPRLADSSETCTTRSDLQVRIYFAAKTVTHGKIISSRKQTAEDSSPWTNRILEPSISQEIKKKRSEKTVSHAIKTGLLMAGRIEARLQRFFLSKRLANRCRTSFVVLQRRSAYEISSVISMKPVIGRK